MPLALVDLDDTLVDRDDAYRRWAADFAAEHALDPDAVAWLIEADEQGYANRLDLFTRARDRFALRADAADLDEAYYAVWPGYLRAFTDVPEALGELRAAGWAIAIVTNGGPGQAQKVVAAGLDRLVDGVAVSRLVGAAKPDARIFHAAAAMAGSSLDGAWMVGDHPAFDIGGGQALGLRTIWIARGRTWLEPDHEPTAIVETFAEAARVMLGA